MSKLPYTNQAIKDEHIKEANAKRVGIYGWNSDDLEWVRLSVDENGNLNTGGSAASVYTTRRDAGDVYTYYGEAVPGSQTSTASWRIRREYVDSGVEIVEFADGNSNFDNIWDNRASLDYGFVIKNVVFQDGNNFVFQNGDNFIFNG